MRIGHGFDAHRLVEGRPCMIGGVEIPYEKGLLGHSDADVLLHAICDALLGSCAMGDIGKHFPDKDPSFRGISSMELLKRTCNLIAPYRVLSLDATIVAQEPKMAPYLLKMRENIASVLQTDVSAISVKATTTEKMGFTGSGEGIAAHAVCLTELEETKNG